MNLNLWRSHLALWHDFPRAHVAGELAELLTLHDSIHDTEQELHHPHRHRVCGVADCAGLMVPIGRPAQGRWWTCDSNAAHHRHSHLCIEPDGSEVCICGLDTRTTTEPPTQGDHP